RGRVGWGHRSIVIGGIAACGLWAFACGRFSAADGGPPDATPSEAAPDVGGGDSLGAEPGSDGPAQLGGDQGVECNGRSCAVGEQTCCQGACIPVDTACANPADCDDGIDCPLPQLCCAAYDPPTDNWTISHCRSQYQCHNDEWIVLCDPNAKNPCPPD